MSLYYLWRGLGYEPEELTYLSVKVVKEKIDEVARLRKEAKEEKIITRSKKGGPILTTTFSEDIKFSVEHNGEVVVDIKERWKGVEGLDGDVKVKSAPVSPSPRHASP